MKISIVFNIFISFFLMSLHSLASESRSAQSNGTKIRRTKKISDFLKGEEYETLLGYISQKEGINCRSATKDNLLLYISTELEEIRKVQGQLAKVKLNIIKTEIDDFLKIYQTLYMQKQREGIEDPMLQKCLFLVKQSDFFNKEYYELCLPFFIDKVHNDLPKDASELLASNGIKSVMDQKLIDQSYVQLINGVREPLEMVQGAALQLGKDLEILEKIKMQLSKKLQSKKKPKSQINSRTIMVQ